MTFATLSWSGWTPVRKDMLAILEMGDAMLSHMRLIIFGGILKGPVDLFISKLLISVLT